MCLSVPVQLHHKQGWPQAVRSGPNVDDWLGKKCRQGLMNFPCVFVPKRLKGRNVGEGAKGESGVSNDSVCLHIKFLCLYANVLIQRVSYFWFRELEDFFLPHREGDNHKTWKHENLLRDQQQKMLPVRLRLLLYIYL